MVALLDESKLSVFLETLANKYYKEVCGIKSEDVSSHVFITQPGQGANIFTPWGILVQNEEEMSTISLCV